MKKVKMLLLVIILILIFVILSGCWNYREIDFLLIVAGIAIDKGENQRYHITCDAVNVTEGSGKEAAAKSLLIECDGDTIFDALRNAVKVSDKKLFYSDCQIMIVSKQIAQEGIAAVLDLMNRDAEPRIDIDVIVSKANSAQDVIKSKGLTNQIASYETDKTVERNTTILSKAAQVPLYKANNLLSGDGISLVLPSISVGKNMGEPVTALDGSAVFKKDKLLGFLNDDESKLFLFITNDIKGGLWLVREESADPDISLEIKSCESKIKAEIIEDHPKINIDIKTQCALAELQTSSDYETVDGIKKIQNDASQQLQDEIKQFILKVQTEYDSDIFGFGNKINQTNHKYWETIKSDWDSIFSTLEVDVTAEVKILDTATTRSMIKVGGSQ